MHRYFDVKKKPQQRSFVVFVSLVGVLSLTSALLLALAPAPLRPDASASLFAAGNRASLDVVFQTRVAPSNDRWTSIYIHHSRTSSGSAVSLARGTEGLDSHFLIGNGDGAADGEIQVTQRWNQQLPPTAPRGARAIDPGAISICLVGDLEQTVPTSAQMRQLTDLARTLQSRFNIPAPRVQFTDATADEAGIGRYFPSRAFTEQLKP